MCAASRVVCVTSYKSILPVLKRRDPLTVTIISRHCRLPPRVASRSAFRRAAPEQRIEAPLAGVEQLVDFGLRQILETTARTDARVDEF